MSQHIIHRAATRGHANHGWLDSHHTFSFANYHDPERMHFGALRVLNDDQVAPGMGFGTHPHHNMEIISIPLEGALEHKDSMGNQGVIRAGDVQVMSAGTGIEHSEFNHSKTLPVKFLQIWLFPNEKDVTPRYDQWTFAAEDRVNRFQQVLSPHREDEGMWIHQDAWFYLSRIERGKALTYSMHKEGNGLYAFVIEGEVRIDGERLSRRDGIGITATDTIEVEGMSDAEVLWMEVPMQLG